MIGCGDVRVTNSLVGPDGKAPNTAVSKVCATIYDTPDTLDVPELTPEGAQQQAKNQLLALRSAQKELPADAAKGLEDLIQLEEWKHGLMTNGRTGPSIAELTAELKRRDEQANRTPRIRQSEEPGRVWISS